MYPVVMSGEQTDVINKLIKFELKYVQISSRRRKRVLETMSFSAWGVPLAH